MSEPVLVALISALGLILSGVLVELARARRRQDGLLDRLETDMGELQGEVTRLRIDIHQLAVSHARVETRLAEMMMRRRVTDG
jgi:hypothetical protein